MLEYIKDYGVKDNDYNYIISNVPSYILEIMALSENKVREVLDYYNKVGLKEYVTNIILNRPDLIIIDREVLEASINKIKIEAFVNIVKNSINDLILLGI